MKRILFVDDEAQARDSMRARLHSHRADWDMQFVESGAVAIAAMEAKPYDVIVTELAMPQMTGTQLLTVMRARWPSAVRVVLTGDPSGEHALQLVPLAHRFLSKPCDVQQLENAITRCFRLQALLEQPALHATVGRIERLPAVPRTYARLQAALANPDVTPRTIAPIVGSDPVIAAKVLQVVNSAFFRLARKISRIEDAINYLGFASIRSLVLSVEIFAKWPAQAKTAKLQPEELQAHVQRVTAAARALTAGTALVDDVTLAALMHDIGYWVIMQEYPDKIDALFEMARQEHIPLYEAESRIIGSSHAAIGAYLLGLWGLPFNVIEAVAHHHTPTVVAPGTFDVLAALAVACALAREAAPQSPLYADTEPTQVDAAYWDALGAPFDWAEAKRRVHSALQEHESS